MIFDNIRNCKMYYGVNERFEKAFNFIKKAINSVIFCNICIDFCIFEYTVRFPYQD